MLQRMKHILGSGFRWRLPAALLVVVLVAGFSIYETQRHRSPGVGSSAEVTLDMTTSCAASVHAFHTIWMTGDNVAVPDLWQGKKVHGTLRVVATPNQPDVMHFYTATFVDDDGNSTSMFSEYGQRNSVFVAPCSRQWASGS